MRHTRPPFVVLLLLVASLGLGACGDGIAPTEPAVEVEPSHGLITGILNLLNPVTVLEREDELERDEVATARITRAGGFLRLEEAGLVVYVPPGAVSAPVEITVTAPAGDLVGYHFQPHGLEFDRRVWLVQDLDETEVDDLPRLLGRRLVGAYFEGELKPVVQALEILPVRILGGLLGHDDDDSGTALFGIDHFSGYVIATN